VIAMVAYSAMQAAIEPFTAVPNADGEITIAGRMLGEVQYIAGYVNHGAFAASSCFVDPTVARPRFRVTCVVDAQDASARIQLVYAQPRRVLAVPFAQVLARRPDTKLVFPGAPQGESHGATSADEFSRLVVARLNRVRGDAGLPPVRLCLPESATAAAVARHYFAAARGSGPPEDMDTIALGLLAGWQVVGLIREGSFVSNLMPHTRDPKRWLDSTLAMPIGRSTLMDPQIEEVALGPVLLDRPDAVGAVVIGYRFHHGDDHTNDVRRLLVRASLARRRRHLEAPARLGPMMPIMKEELARVHDGQAQPEEALQAVLDRGVARFGAGMRGWVLETTSLDALQIPEEILGQPTLHLEIGVTHHKPKGAAWAQFVILVVFVDYGAAAT
jgi:hypothetical protein